MIHRRTILAGTLLAAAAGVPYMASQRDHSGAVSQSDSTAGSGGWWRWLGETFSVQHDPSQTVWGNLSGATFDWEPPVIDFVSDFREVFRFDASPNWVKRRGPRVSTSPEEWGLVGMRVALVTGTHPTDLSGSLTYYFDHNQRVQRIVFRGFTGDASRLVHVATNQFGFVTRPTRGAGLYMQANVSRVSGVLALDHPPVVRRDEPWRQLAVYWELTHPNGTLPITREGHEILAAFSP